jgi:hypothetical protein
MRDRFLRILLQTESDRDGEWVVIEIINAKNPDTPREMHSTGLGQEILKRMVIGFHNGVIEGDVTGDEIWDRVTCKPAYCTRVRLPQWCDDASNANYSEDSDEDYDRDLELAKWKLSPDYDEEEAHCYRQQPPEDPRDNFDPS